MISKRLLHSLVAGCAQSVLFLVIISTSGAMAQESQYDRGTPPQLAAGVASFGSYTSAEMGNINLANGSLNFNLPVGVIGGRGFSLPLSLSYSSKLWSAQKGTELDERYSPPTRSTAYAVYDDGSNWFGLANRIAAGWTLGAVPHLKVQGVGVSPASRSNSCNETGPPGYITTLTRLTLVFPDKGEVELRDDQTDGRPLPEIPYGCGSGDGYRGRRWHATDGSGLIFITDVDNGIVIGNWSGVAIAADGTRYRFIQPPPYPTQPLIITYNSGMLTCSSITDRNGNLIQISSGANSTSFTDQLGRVTTIQKNVPDPADPGVTLALLITLPGYQGAPRYLKARTGIMNQHYRAGIAPVLPVINGDFAPIGGVLGWPGPHTSLFPYSYGSEAERIDTKEVLTEIILPDNRSLSFRYNQFGEIAEVTLPTGGKVQYDYTYVNTLPSGNSTTVEIKGQIDPNNSVAEIDRAVTARRTYPDGNTTGAPEATWSYVYGSQSSSQSTEVTARAGNETGPVTLNQRHFFVGAGRYIAGTDKNGVTVMSGTGYRWWSTGLEWRTETRDAGGNVLSAVEQDWSQRAPVVWTGYAQEQPENDNRVSQTRRYLDTGSFAKTEIFYDDSNNVRANNVREVKEYDYDQSLKRRSTTTYLLTNNSYNYFDDSIFLLRLPLETITYDASGNQMAKTTYEYDRYTGTNNAPLTDYGVTISGRDATYNGNRTTRGNVTAVKRWLSTTGGTLDTFQRYDILGNLVSARDARGFESQISYADNYGDGSNPDSGNANPATPTYALPTLLTSPDPGNGYGVHTARSQYDYQTGLLTGFKDRNGVKTQTIYNDPFNRPTLVKAALGTTIENHTVMYYAGAPVQPPPGWGVTLDKNDVLTAKDLATVDDAALRAWTKTDGFGRTIEGWSRDPQGDVKVVSVYDALSRVRQVSNPYRPSAGESPVYTTTTFDLAGRVLTVTTPDTATVTTAYSGNQVRVTDQAGKQRLSQTGALGWLTDVWEITAAAETGVTEAVTFNGSALNGYRTKYQYDALSNLKTVTQQAGTAGTMQTRTFNYDSLSRLTSATNPESGTVTYQYDSNSNLTGKTDARGVTTTYGYDALNRNTSLTHLPVTNGTTDTYFWYDTATNGKGRFGYSVSYNARWYGDGRPYWHADVTTGYDALGRATGKWQGFMLFNAQGAATTWQPYNLSRTYNLAGGVTSETYPSGRVVNYSYNSAGQLNSFTGRLGGLTGTGGSDLSYAADLKYNSRGQMIRESFGTNTTLYHRMYYNRRGQMFDTRLGTDGNASYDVENPAVWKWANGTWNRGALRLYYSSTNNDYDDYTASGPTLASNNGNIWRAEHFVPNAVDGSGNITSWVLGSDGYEYDALNRVTSVSETATGGTGTGFTQKFLYDRWGNRGIDVANTTPNVPGVTRTNLSFNAANNRLTAIDGVAVAYDSAGNQTTISASGQPDYELRDYDAENRMTRATKSGVTSYYHYDGSGKRVRRVIGGAETWQVYGFEGELVAEYNVSGTFTGSNAPSAATPVKEYGYRSGQMLVVFDSTETGDNQLRWMVTDHLGSTRMLVNRSGSLTGMKRRDYLPFGEELAATIGHRAASGSGYQVTDKPRQKFTGHERDTETGLDYMQARYCSSVQGRFTSVDPLMASGRAANPQSWNRYAYVLNRPLSLIDPGGMEDQEPHRRELPQIAQPQIQVIPMPPPQLPIPTTPTATTLQPPVLQGIPVLQESIAAARELLLQNRASNIILFGGRDPVRFLDNYVANNLITIADSYPNGSGTTAFSNADTGAVTSIAAASYLNPNGVLVSANPITINANGFLVTGNTTAGIPVSMIRGGGFEGVTDLRTIRGLAMIHETAHGLGAIPSDGASHTQSRANSERIRQLYVPRPIPLADTHNLPSTLTPPRM